MTLDLPPLDQILPVLAEYIALPSISRSADLDTMRRTASWVAEQLAFADGRVVETNGFPVVRGEWLGAPDAPTILVYGHYDVQPTGDLAEWTTDPFDMVVDGEVIRGRGVTDDKGPVFLVLRLAQAFIAQEGRLPLNVKFLIEGEEEIGSPNLPDYVRDHAEELACDLVISADGAQWRPGEPSVSIASKGLVGMDIVVTGASNDLHSGRFGGTVANPVHALSALLASLHTSHGRVAVPGFYDGVSELSPERRAEIAAVPFDETAYADGLGVPELFGEEWFTTLERLWERPTLEITGITAGGKYSVIPHVATGHIASRLVGAQDPDHIAAVVTRHIEANAPVGVSVEVRVDDARVPAYRIDPDHPAIRAASAALETVYPGDGVLLAVIAGTLPATTLFESALGAKTLFFSFSTSDENLHAPNEYLRLPRIHEGMRAWETLWRLLAEGEHRLASGAALSEVAE
jgi:acetylornithine deacetylase/succinyl-diaminopimelate desuccinylase-like protein